ncbi:1-deoxy-D-xylulose-5-phosphate reductoisomerase [Clostridium aminobutyricum]|uniref:1-deoxy-D-xylulose 5-phosphate reductoisomerase n=1 Tax=Clostridium aminobutyricum TaxID=33953 RepID=A0A939D656_CLOAM|nr:1-deoxy-D-xylulose-5-phosphate reductoisomerase [Clostridium aminobutyricum]MBN7772129.1 1-deoxy-D-xylulose-5-phosphate reductoisomerase [Clostridium aminobutyricum]
MKKIALLGSTGSIGTQALDIIENNRDRFQVTVLSCAKNTELLSKQIKKFNPLIVVVDKEEDARELAQIHKSIEILHGPEGLVEAAASSYDILLNSLVGMRGLVPTYHAICQGRDIALANKETLVAGGELVMTKVAEKGIRLLPVDSEHSAIFQALEGNKREQLKKIYLTASGGPFRGYTLQQLEHVTLEQALKHPNWNMGSKITIDSASMMNKGLEVIEAKWLFDVPVDKIQVAVHPQSVVHSMVEYVDHSIIAQLGNPDMRVPISYALGYPDRLENAFEPLDLFGMGAHLTFEKPDLTVFKTIQLAYESVEKGGSYPVILNGANEALVELFLNKKIKFIDIQNNIERILHSHVPSYNLKLEDILEADQLARRLVKELVG